MSAGASRDSASASDVLRSLLAFLEGSLMVTTGLLSELHQERVLQQADVEQLTRIQRNLGHCKAAHELIIEVHKQCLQHC